MTAPESLGAFVNSVCNNVLFEMYRSSTRAAPLEEGFDPPDDASGAETAIMADEERARVRDALAALPVKERELLTWLFFEERDRDVICRDLKIDRNYLRVLVHRAKARFKTRFSSEGTK
jgi:RNA polymerase sigma-70 factor (ECF subfamily)